MSAPSGTRARDPLRDARRLYAKGWYSKARRAAESLLESAPNYAPAHTLLARIALAQGSVERAQTLAERALSAEAGHGEALGVLGECHVHAGRHDEAVAVLTDCVVRAPEDAQAFAHLAFASQSLDRLDDAVTAYERAIELAPDSALVHHNYATALKRCMRIDEAAAAYRRAVELAPDDAVLHNKLGISLNENGEFEEAARSLERATELNPSDVEAYGHLAYAHMKLGDGRRSVAAARRLCALTPGNVDTTLTLARSLMTEGSMQEAHAIFERILAQVPDNRNAFADDAIALAQLGQKDAARQIVDFDALLNISRVEPPDGFDTIAQFNDSLVAHMCSHPTLNLSTNSLSCHHGDTSGELLVEPKGPLALLEQRLNAAAESYRRERLEAGAHPYIAMLPEDWELSAWTTRLESQGYQHGHIHATAHLSGVYYVNLPDAVTDASTDAGWIEFGRAPLYYGAKDQGEVRTVKPEPGMLLLFPSYIYHRTIPFESNEPRITIAFDFRLPGTTI